MYKYIYTYTYIYISTHTHTHTRTCSRSKTSSQHWSSTADSFCPKHPRGISTCTRKRVLY